MEMFRNLPIIPEEYRFLPRLSKRQLVTIDECTQYEFYRLSTFRNWPLSHKVSPVFLAKAGLYYTGNNTETRCFRCGLTLSEWEGTSDVFDQHKRNNPTCPLLVATDTTNKPMVVSEVSSGVVSPVTLVGEGQQLVERATTTRGADPNLLSENCNMPRTSQLQEVPTSEEQNDGVKATETGLHNPADMTVERNRLETFTTWPSTYVLPEALAKNGFYYIGPGDRVQCAYCTGIIRDWEPGDDVAQEHQRHFGQICSFVKQNLTTAGLKVSGSARESQAKHNTQSQTKAMSLPQGSRNTKSTPQRTQWQEAGANMSSAPQGRRPSGPEPKQPPKGQRAVEGFRPQQGQQQRAQESAGTPAAEGFRPQQEQQHRAQESAGTPAAEGFRPQQGQQHRAQESAGTPAAKGFSPQQEQQHPAQTSAVPQHPEYANFEARFETFTTWPRNYTLTPNELVVAGFFYEGHNDSVRCFHCGGGLRNWERDDVPWVEHARWFPRCGHLDNVKGHAFIDQVQRTKPGTWGPGPRGSGNMPGIGEQSVQAEHKLPLNGGHERQALDMGFSEADIHRAVSTRQDHTGRGFPDLQTLLDALLDQLPETQPTTTQSRLPPDVATNSTGQPHDATTGLGRTGDEDGQKTAKQWKKKKPKGGSGDLVSPEPFEKEESHSLREENRQLKEQRQCKVCMDEDVNVVFLPCGHLVCCSNCAPALRTCPICRALIRGNVKTFLS